ncbi:MAG: hypothetical protein K0S29_944, partial [Gammaproteobacteria bacterium]|nr:hypothetical protein [Gammaproteobacteria bacterium]
MNGGKTQYTVPGARVGTLDHGPTYAARFGAGIKERFKAYQERSAAAAADAPSADTSSDSLLGGKSRVQLRREKIKKALLIGVPTGAVITVAALMVAFRCEWFGADCPAPVDTSFRATGGGIKFTHNGETVGPLANVVLLGGDLAVNTTGIYQIFFSGPATAANATAIFGNSVIFLDADNPYAAFNITSPSRAEAQIFANGEQVSAMGPATLSTLVQFAQADQLTQVING